MGELKGPAIVLTDTMTNKLVVPTLDYFRNRILCTDALTLLNSLPGGSVHCIVTSPPYYGLRDYQVDGQLGLEDTPEAYIARLVTLFREARRVLRDDGVFWLNLGDSYSTHRAGVVDDPMLKSGLGGTRTATIANSAARNRPQYRNSVLPEKNLLGIPWRVALALQADGWILRSDIIWNKPNPMPERVKDRCTKSHEYVFMFAKSPRYFYDQEAVREGAVVPIQDLAKREGKNAGNKLHAGARGEIRYTGNMRPGAVMSGHPLGRNKRSVWTVATTQPYSAAHFATFPPRLIVPMIKAGCPKGGTVCDPFMGAGTTGLVARRLGRDYVGCDLNPEYVAMARKRIDQEDPTKPKVLATGEVQLSLFADAVK